MTSLSPHAVADQIFQRAGMYKPHRHSSMHMMNYTLFTNKNYEANVEGERKRIVPTTTSLNPPMTACIHINISRKQQQ